MPPINLDDFLASRFQLSLPPDLDFERWREAGAALSRLERGVQWAIGDWWAFGQHHYGDRVRFVAEGIFGLSLQTLMNYGSIARAFEGSRRREVLPFGLHAEVVGLPPEEQEELLDQAEAQHWSRQELRLAIQRRRASRATKAKIDTVLLPPAPAPAPIKLQYMAPAPVRTALNVSELTNRRHERVQPTFSNSDFGKTIFQAAARDLRSFENRYRGDRELAPVVDKVRQALILVEQLLQRH
jgi:hypothetical protein